jgi:transcriptional regulator with XRE-family HTH domain
MEIREVRLSRLVELLAEEDGHRAKLAGRLGISPSQLSQWLGRHRTITEESARKIESKARKPPAWLDGRNTPTVEGVAHPLILDVSTVPPTIGWGELMGADEVPQRFGVAMPDDALSPNVPRGTVLYFAAVSSEKRPTVGDGVLVQDGAGKRYIRRLGEGPGGEWTAQALHPAYITLESQAHGLTILAVMTGREGSRV